jgi:hypothetical protein
VKRKQEEAKQDDEENEGAVRNGLLAMTPKIDVTATTTQDEKRPWWKFWSQN